MKIIVENKNGEVVRETEYNPTGLMVGAGLGLGYGLLVRKAYILACKGGIVPTVLGTLLGSVVGVCVGKTTYDLITAEPAEKEDIEDGSIG